MAAHRDKRGTGDLIGAVNEADRAEIDHLSEAIDRILPALETFNRFEGPDRVGRQRAAWMAALDEPLPEEGAGLEPVLRALSRDVIPNGVRIGAPAFAGWVTTAPTTSGTAAALAASVAGAQRYWIQAFNALEGVALRWLGELLGLPSEWFGIFVSGGSVANLVGLGAARQHAFERIGHDPARDGMPPHPRCRIYAGSEVHHVVTRAAAVLGMGRRAVASIPVDGAQRIDLDLLRAALEADSAEGILPVALVASAGTVNTGAVDPIDEMADIAARHNTWLHVDGAYGLFGVLDPRVAPLFRGLERADSAAVDPHKWLAAPLGCGAAYVRDRALVARAFTLEAAAYLDEDSPEHEIASTFDDLGDPPYHHFSPEHSAPSRGVRVWAILKEIGAAGMRDRVVRHNSFARHLASRVEADDRLELLADPVLSICCFRYRAPGLGEKELNELNAEIVHRLHVEGTHVPSATRVAGQFAIRPCYINPRTTLAEVDDLADRVREMGDALRSA
jgi:glutamate/tyrosine decarboxylase-like PLP-dependent enzyme